MALGQFTVSLNEADRNLLERGIAAIQELSAVLPEKKPRAPVGVGTFRTFVHSPGSPVQAVSGGSTVRVPEGMVAVMVPKHLMRTAIDAVLKQPAREGE